MSAVTWLRIASALAAVQGIAHGTLVISARPRHGAAETAVVEAMKANYFNFGGGLRSYWGFYFGYGLMVAVFCVVESVLFWQLARIATTNAGLARPIIWLFVFANLVHAALATRYFFWAPVVFDILVIGALCAALMAARRGDPGGLSV